jgi:hypothetical protein
LNRAVFEATEFALQREVALVGDGVRGARRKAYDEAIRKYRERLSRQDEDTVANLMSMYLKPTRRALMVRRKAAP